MNKILKNILLIVATLVLSYFTAEYFGKIYDYFSPLYDSSFFPLSKEILISMAGLPFAYTFFTIILFKLFGAGNKNKCIGWLLVPPFLFFASGDLKHIYLPIVLALISLGLATILRKVFRFT
jgi:hypothetical protein